MALNFISQPTPKRRYILLSVVAVAFIALGGGVAQLSTSGLPDATIIKVTRAHVEPALLPLRALSVSELLLPPALAAEFPVEEPPCDPRAQIPVAEKLLIPVQLKVGKGSYGYTEYRASGEIQFSDPEKEIALQLLDSKTCELSQVVITKKGKELIAPRGYEIEVVTRVNGIRWNNWATEYRVVRPEGLAVIANKYPLVQDGTVTPVIYTPYSRELHIQEFVDGGRGFLSDLAAKAFTELRRLGVPSSTNPKTLVADVGVLKPEYVERLVPNELMDLTEFTLDPTWTTERILVVIGANQNKVAAFTCSKASACGLMQFTAGTYALMRQLYPEAQLTKDFIAGARDPLNAMKAAVLLHDYNLSYLMEVFGDQVARDPHLEEYLAAAYNTGVGRVRAVLAYARQTKSTDWAQVNGDADNAHLLNETKGYIAKLRYLREQWAPPPLAQAD